jgi:hypothetical protein
MYIPMNMYICEYLHNHTSVYLSFICMYVYICMYYICMRGDRGVRTVIEKWQICDTYMCIYIYIFIFKYLHVFMSIFMHIYIHTYIYILKNGEYVNDYFKYTHLYA